MRIEQDVCGSDAKVGAKSALANPPDDSAPASRVIAPATY
jgi:hypothetical protein